MIKSLFEGLVKPIPLVEPSPEQEKGATNDTIDVNRFCAFLITTLAVKCIKGFLMQHALLTRRPFCMSQQNHAKRSNPVLSQVAERYLEYGRVDQRFSAQTIDRYRYCISRAIRSLGDLPVTQLDEVHIRKLKLEMIDAGHTVHWQIVMLSTLKGVVQFCRNRLGLAAVDPSLIIVPTRPWYKVIYLTVEEVDRFVQAIPLKTQKGQVHHQGLRFRALVEVLLGTAMRIGEVLSLNRADIDFPRKEARVIGKGNKERFVFFTDRSLFWLRQYLESRADDKAALFVSQNGTRLDRLDIWRPFARYRKLAGINKPVRPHLLRHTAATQLLFNGCPVGHIKEILGHERLETTCRYYLGLDIRAAKAAHQKYLVYDS